MILLDMRQGWICPRCDKVHSPDTLTCLCFTDAGITEQRWKCSTCGGYFAPRTSHACGGSLGLGTAGGDITICL